MVQTSKSQAKLRLRANPAHFGCSTQPLTLETPPLSTGPAPPHLMLVPIGRSWMLYTHPKDTRLAKTSLRLRSSAISRLGTGGWRVGGGGRAVFLRNKKLRIPRSWLRGSCRIGSGRPCCGSRRGGCDGDRARAQHSRRGRSRQPAVLVDVSATAARALHEQAAAATGAAAPAVFGPRGGTRSRLLGAEAVACGNAFCGPVL